MWFHIDIRIVTFKKHLYSIKTESFWTITIIIIITISQYILSDYDATDPLGMERSHQIFYSNENRNNKPNYKQAVGSTCGYNNTHFVYELKTFRRILFRKRSKLSLCMTS